MEQKTNHGKRISHYEKHSWSALHRNMKSSFNGERLMTTRYVDKSRKKKAKLNDGWRGNDPTVFCESAKMPECLGILPPPWFPCSSIIRNK